MASITITRQKLITMGSGRMTRGTALESLVASKNTTKGSGKMAVKKVTDTIWTESQMIHMLESLGTTKNVVKEEWSMAMEAFIQEIFIMTYRMDRDSLSS